MIKGFPIQVEGYTFIEKVASGQLTDSWVAQDTKRKQKVFLKCPPGNGRTAFRESNDRIKRCFSILQKIRHPCILNPLGLVENKQVVSIKFPYFSKKQRMELTPRLFERIFPTFLPKICIVIDYLHCMDLVHCDIKADNFLLVGDLQDLRLYLTDFDLAVKAYSRHRKKLFGTPDHIAPEILRDEMVVPQCDHFSLGVMLFNLVCSSAAGQRTDLGESLRAGITHQTLSDKDVTSAFVPLVPFINSLLRANPLERPIYLGELVRTHESLFGNHAKQYDKQLLRMVFKSKYRQYVHSQSQSKRTFAQFLSDDVKLIGIPDELLKDTGQSIASHPFSVIRSLNKILNSSKLTRVDNYWHLTLEQSAISKCYTGDWVTQDIKRAALEHSGNNWRQILLLALQLKARKEYLKSLVVIEKLLFFPKEHLLVEAKKLRPAILLKAGQLYKGCGFVVMAHACFKEAIDSQRLSPRKKVYCLLAMAEMNLKGQSKGHYLEFLRKAAMIAREHRFNRERLAIFSKRCWMVYIEGNPRRALGKFKIIREIAKRAGFTDRYSSILNSIAIIQRSLGKLEKAKSTLHAGIGHQQQTGNLRILTALHNNLAYTLYDLGEYDESIESANKALKLVETTKDVIKSIFACASLCWCYTIQGRYDLADQSLVKHLDANIRAGHIAGIGAYYLNKGWLNLKRANLDIAYVDLGSAMRVFCSAGLDEYKGRALFNLATLHFWRGNYDQARQLAEEARAIFKEHGDLLCKADTEIVLLQITAWETGKLDKEKLLQVLHDCVNMHGYWEAMSCLFLLASSLEGIEVINYVKTWPTLNDYLRSSSTPLSLGLVHLINYWSLTSENRASEAVRELKQSFLTFQQAKLYFNAIAILNLLVHYYEHEENPKLAVKFLEESKILSERLNNDAMSESINRKISSLKRRESHSQANLKLLYEVSSLLNSLSDYRKVQAKILKYAIDATGAERGVLLVIEPLSKKLRVETSYDCDTQSIRDVTEISNSVIESVYRGGKPCLIDDATQHPATKRYKSIVIHNILSIVCIPLVVRSELVGALYLDHHTLPGLFTADDHEMIEALANLAAVVLHRSGRIRKLESENLESSKLLEKHGIRNPFITKSHSVIELLDKLHLFANSSSSMLICGESGTGNEVLADLIHKQSGRCNVPFVKINCASLEGSLLEAELFGVEKGTATGVTPRHGKFETADGGTLLLDEIGDMPLSTQAKILRVLENQQFERLGSNRPIHIDVRYISATNKDLRKQIEAGKFREDLYYRINTVELHIPPLRERTEDIMPLLNHFLEVFGRSEEYSFTTELVALLKTYFWPGNVRELRNFAELLSLVTPPGTVDVGDLPKEFSVVKQEHKADGIKQKVQQMERDEIKRLLIELNWNQSAVARRLPISLSTLRRRIIRYKIVKRDSEELS